MQNIYCYFLCSFSANKIRKRPCRKSASFTIWLYSGKYGVYMVGCLTAGEREVWMERIVQSMGTRLNTFRNIANFKADICVFPFLYIAGTKVFTEKIFLTFLIPVSLSLLKFLFDKHWSNWTLYSRVLEILSMSEKIKKEKIKMFCSEIWNIIL